VATVVFAGCFPFGGFALAGFPDGCFFSPLPQSLCLTSEVGLLVSSADVDRTTGAGLCHGSSFNSTSTDWLDGGGDDDNAVTTLPQAVAAAAAAVSWPGDDDDDEADDDDDDATDEAGAAADTGFSGFGSGFSDRCRGGCC